MSELNMTIPSGTTRTFHTAGKYCDKDISVTATGGDYGKGYDDGVTDGIEQGKQAEYDAFWDNYQQSGNRDNYEYGFSGNGWNDETFKPKYDIRPTKAGNIFTLTSITDLVQLLDTQGVHLDFSNVSDTGYISVNSKTLTTFPTADCRKRSHMNYTFSGCDKLRSIEKVILKSDGSQAFSANSFNALSALEEIRFEGCIGKSLEIKGSPLLSTESVNSIISCLKDLTGTTSQILTFHADVGARLTEVQSTTITAKNWQLVY